MLWIATSYELLLRPTYPSSSFPSPSVCLSACLFKSSSTCWVLCWVDLPIETIGNGGGRKGGQTEMETV